MTPPANKWVPVLDALILQTYYRNLGMVSIHGPMAEVFQAAQYIQTTKRGGNLNLVFALPNLITLPGLRIRFLSQQMAKWENLTVFPGITETLTLFGGPDNTVLVRSGFWTLYAFELPASLAVIPTLRSVPLTADLSEPMGAASNLSAKLGLGLLIARTVRL